MALRARPDVLALATSLALAGCSGSGGPTSASLLATGTSPIKTGAISADPTARVLQVGATSARASHCEFFFDPVKLKANFLASEAAQGANPQQLQKIERDYEFVRISVAQTIAKQPDYCSQPTSNVIKADLARHLAGDFTPTLKKSDQGPGLMTVLFEPSSSDGKPFTYESVFDITGKTKNSGG